MGQNPHEIFLSVVIPAYNEEERISQTLEHMISFLKRQGYRSEIIVVDDGSTDQTSVAASQQLKDFSHRILRNSPHQGKGAAVKRGMLAAVGEYLLFSDADMSTPIEEVGRFIDLLKKGNYDCVIGSRALPESQLEVRQGLFRETIGKIFNFLARRLSFQGISDSQCGFKCFKREAAHDLFGRQRLKGFSFDAEILYLAQRRGYRILEAPVIWRNSAKSRVQILSDPFRMFFDLLRIRRLHRS